MYQRVFYITNENQLKNALYYYQRSTCFGQLCIYMYTYTYIHIHIYIINVF